MASLRGFEPPAYRLGGGRSILLSYSDIKLDLFIIAPFLEIFNIKVIFYANLPNNGRFDRLILECTV